MKNRTGTIDIKKNIFRIYGVNPILTAEKLALTHFKDASTVYLINVHSYPDALSALNLTKGRSPLLWIEGDVLHSHTQQTLEKISPKKIILIGDERRISKKIEQMLEKKYVVRRIGGKTVYETNAKTLQYATQKNIIVTCADDYSGSLLAPTLALMTDAMIVLTYGHSLSDEIFHVLKEKNVCNSFIAAGLLVISPWVSHQLKKISTYRGRIVGPNRFFMNAKIAEQFPYRKAVLVNGEGYYDAFSASVLAQKLHAPILLVNKDHASDKILKEIQKKVTDLYVVGNYEQVSVNLERLLYHILHPAKKERHRPGIHSVNFILKLYNFKDWIYRDVALQKPWIPIRKLEDSSMYVSETITTNHHEDLLKVHWNNHTGYVRKRSTLLQTTGFRVLDVPYISQLLPYLAFNGCELASLLMALHYRGVCLDKDLSTFIDEMKDSPFSQPPNGDPALGFVGNPYALFHGGYKSIDPKPLAAFGKRYYPYVYNIEGSSIDEIKNEVLQGNPVIVYSTFLFMPAKISSFTIYGKRQERVDNCHALLVIGYNSATERFFIADPLNGPLHHFGRTYWMSQDRLFKGYRASKFAVTIR